MGQEVLQDNGKVLEKDEGLDNVERCVKLYPKVVAKISQNSGLKQRLVKQLLAINKDLSELINAADLENEEFFEVNLTDLTEEKIS